MYSPEENDMTIMEADLHQLKINDPFLVSTNGWSAMW